ncbi:hypothetical protein UFOVP724_72 [uncultured Caudovirales phage]|uniref:Uncharacterized protein n=1 Tax=uncultured Caudovirales phage TaxID=2100421 RepID=A0A6J5NR04_9CAUD|nr:hypothetical protein UFOVP724_72 [uncultured Caudovirales phage]
MKRYCFNAEACGWVEYIEPEEFDPKQERFFYCPECRFLAAIVPNDFSLDDKTQFKIATEDEDDSNEE